MVIAIEKAQEAGIYVIQVDNPSNYASDAFVGSDWDRLGQLEAIVYYCLHHNRENIRHGERTES